MKTLLSELQLNKLNTLHTITVWEDCAQINNDNSFSAYTTNRPFGYEARENITRGFPS